MADIALLKSEVDNDPLGRNYSAMSDEQVAQSLNNEDRSKTVRISSAELLAWSASDGRLASIKAAIDGGVDNTAKSLAEAAYMMISRDGTSLDLSLADRVAMLDGLVAYGILSADDKSDLVSKSTVSCCRAEELSLGRVRTGDVIQARI